MMDLPFRLIPRAPAGRTDKTLMRPTTRLLLGHIRPATPTNRPGPSRQITFKTSRQSEAESDPNRSHPQYHQPEAQPVLTSEVRRPASTWITGSRKWKEAKAIAAALVVSPCTSVASGYWSKSRSEEHTS